MGAAGKADTAERRYAASMLTIKTIAMLTRRRFPERELKGGSRSMAALTGDSLIGPRRFVFMMCGRDAGGAARRSEPPRR
jgi:hypothetical protein